jgi:hypothetical protein
MQAAGTKPLSRDQYLSKLVDDSDRQQRLRKSRLLADRVQQPSTKYGIDRDGAWHRTN